MAAACGLFTKSLCRPQFVFNGIQKSASRCLTQNLKCSQLFPIRQAEVVSYRYSHSFFSRTSADQLWKGVTSVSAAGRKKGRAKNLVRRFQDLNKGQVIGYGKKNMLWPGLNSPIIRGKEVITQQELPPDDSREKRIIELRDRGPGPRRLKLTPLERGFSGTKLGGRSIGPPAPIGDESFEGFDSRVLKYRTILRMTKRGRTRRMSAFLVVGNKNGLAGYGLSKSPNGMTAAFNARNRAGQALRYIERYKEHTVLHDFHATFGCITVVVRRKHEGYGLVCHRCIRCICEMIGIKDIYAKVYGQSRNYQNITKAFFIGLMQQKNPQMLAEEKGLHVVELRKEKDFFPEVLASPLKCRTEEEIGLHEIIDFNLYCFDGKVVEGTTPYKPFYFNLPCYHNTLKKKERFRNHEEVKRQLVVRYGQLDSFATIRAREKKEREALKEIESA